MDSRTLVERVMRNLSFQVEAIPIKTNKKTFQDKSTSAKPTGPTNVTVKVRKKEINEQYNRGFISNNQSEPEKLLQNVKFVSSHDTIMSFDMLMKEEGNNNINIENKRKPRKHIFNKLKPGICLATTDDDTQPYMPGKHSINASQDTWAAWVSKSEEKFRQYEASRMKTERTWLGHKCKPGGCLDPPFGEDTYHYAPVVQDNEVNVPNNTGIVIPENKLKDGVHSNIKINDNNKSKDPSNSIEHADKAQKPDSVLSLYKNDSKINSIQPRLPDGKDKGITNNIASKDKPRSSVNDPSSTFYSPPKGIKRESNNYEQQDPSTRHLNIPNSTKDKPSVNFPLPIPIPIIINSSPAKRDTGSKTIDGNNHIGEANNEQIKGVPDSNQTEERLAIPIQVDKETTGDKTDYIDSSSPIDDSNNISLPPKNNRQYHQNIDKEGYPKDVDDRNQKQDVKDQGTGKPIEYFPLPVPITAISNSDPAKHDTTSNAIDDINPIGEMQNEQIKAVPNSYHTEQKPKEHLAIPIQDDKKSNVDNTEYIDPPNLTESNKTSSSPKTNNTPYPTLDKEGFLELDDHRNQKQNVNDPKTGKLEEKRRNEKELSKTSIERVVDQANRESIIGPAGENREKKIKNNTHQPSIVDQLNEVHNIIENPNKIHDIIQKPHDEPNIVEKPNKVQNITENPTADVPQNIIENPNIVQNIIGNPDELQDTAEQRVAVQNTTEKPNKVENIMDKPEEVQNTPLNRDVVQNLIENPVKVQNIIEKPDEVQITTENLEAMQNIIEKPTDVQNSTENRDAVQNITENPDKVQNKIEKPFEVQNMIEKPDNVQNTTETRDAVQNIIENPDTVQNNNYDSLIPIKPDVNSVNVHAGLNDKELDITPGKEISSTSKDKSQLENGPSKSFRPTEDESTPNINNYIMDRYGNGRNGNGTDMSQTNDSKQNKEHALELPNKQTVNFQDDTAKSDTKKKVEINLDIQGENVTGEGKGSLIDKTIPPVSNNIEEIETSSEVKGNASSPDDLVTNDLKTVSLNLVFHSYLNNNNERVFKTIIDEKEVDRCPNDSVTVINSQIKASLQEKYPELIVPIDSSLNMVIRIENNNTQSYTVPDKSKILPIFSYVPSAQISNSPGNRKNEGQKASQNDRVLDTTLTDIYEHELIPLQKMMRALKADVDTLAGQHILNKTNVICVNKLPQPKNA